MADSSNTFPLVLAILRGRGGDCRQLSRADVVIMDNLSSHKKPDVREMIEQVGATSPNSTRPLSAPTPSPNAAAMQTDRKPL